MNATKDILKIALMELLEEYPLDKITINDIVKSGHVNRNTFYYHFDDIYDLIDYLFRSEVSSLFEISSIGDEWENDIAIAMNYLLEHKAIIYHLYFSMNREMIENDLFKLFYRLIKTIVKNFHGADSFSKDAEVLIEFYSYGMVGKILSWIKNDMQEAPDVLIEQIKLVLRPIMSKERISK